MLIRCLCLTLATSTLGFSSFPGAPTTYSPLRPSLDKTKRGVIEIGPRTSSWASYGSSPKSGPEYSSSLAQDAPSSSLSASSSSASEYPNVKNSNLGSPYYERVQAFHGVSQQPVSSYGSSQQLANYGSSQQPASSYGSSQQPTSNYGSSQQPTSNYGASQQPTFNYGSNQQGSNRGDYYAVPSRGSGSQGGPGTSSYQAPTSQGGPGLSGYQTSPKHLVKQVHGTTGLGNSHLSTPHYDTYVNSPTTLKVAADGAHHSPQEKASSDGPSPSYGSPSFSSFSSHPSGAYSFGGSPLYTSATHLHHAGPAPIYKYAYPRNSELSHTYAPRHQNAANFAATNLNSHYSGLPTVEFNGKKISLPILQLQSSQSMPSFVQAIEAQPVILGSGLDFQPDLAFDYNFKHSSPPQTRSAPVIRADSTFNRAQVLPVHTARSTPEFPQYQGARVGAFPSFGYDRPIGQYQALTSQPQLHFTNANQPAATHQVINANPNAEIREDVEIIKKKKPHSPPRHDEEEDQRNDGYSPANKDYGRQEESSRPSKFPKTEYKSPKSFPFKSYDEKFGKFSKAAFEGSFPSRQFSKFRRMHTSGEEENDHDGRPSKYHSDYAHPKSQQAKKTSEEHPETEEEDDDEEYEGESQRHEQEDDAEEEEEESAPKSKAYRDYGREFEKEFEESYRRELPRNKYEHVKEVPDIDESSYTSNKKTSGTQDSPRSSRSSSDDRSDSSEESEEQHGTKHSPKKIKSPKYPSYEDYVGHGTSENSKKSPKIVHEDSYGYQKPEEKSYTKYVKDDDGNEKYSNVQKGPKGDSYRHSTKSSFKSASPKKGDNGSYESGDSYSFSSGNSWESNKKPTQKSDSSGNASSTVSSSVPTHPEGESSSASAESRTNPRYIPTEIVLRDLIGI
ncbi:uncharacterized protein LOC105698598 [Orussus abietinus]|uniref:uncharacterized protein LOC105698598 n=1 Tax=Orussus abietinus TaxID=222816 RepID=UPI000625E03D|nr:uncharacterized protein LOC105698598 [Orussus abietinus]